MSSSDWSSPQARACCSSLASEKSTSSTKPDKNTNASRRSSLVQPSSGLQRVLQLHQSRPLAENNPLSLLPRRASQSTARLPRPGKNPEKAEKTATYWYTKFEDYQSSNIYSQSRGKTEEKVPRGSKSSKNSLLGVNQAQKLIYRPKRPEMSGSMYIWCFYGSSTCPKIYEKSIQEVKNQWIVTHLQN